MDIVSEFKLQNSNNLFSSSSAFKSSSNHTATFPTPLRLKTSNLAIGNGSSNSFRNRASSAGNTTLQKRISQSVDFSSSGGVTASLSSSAPSSSAGIYGNTASHTNSSLEDRIQALLRDKHSSNVSSSAPTSNGRYTTTTSSMLASSSSTSNGNSSMPLMGSNATRLAMATNASNNPAAAYDLLKRPSTTSSLPLTNGGYSNNNGNNGNTPNMTIGGVSIASRNNSGNTGFLNQKNSSGNSNNTSTVTIPVTSMHVGLSLPTVTTGGMSAMHGTNGGTGTPPSASSSPVTLPGSNGSTPRMNGNNTNSNTDTSKRLFHGIAGGNRRVTFGEPIAQTEYYYSTFPANAITNANAAIALTATNTLVGNTGSQRGRSNTPKFNTPNSSSSGGGNTGTAGVGTVVTAAANGVAGALVTFIKPILKGAVGSAGMMASAMGNSSSGSSSGSSSSSSGKMHHTGGGGGGGMSNITIALPPSNTGNTGANGSTTSGNTTSTSSGYYTNASSIGNTMNTITTMSNTFSNKHLLVGGNGNTTSISSSSENENTNISNTSGGATIGGMTPKGNTGMSSSSLPPRTVMTNAFTTPAPSSSSSTGSLMSSEVQSIANHMMNEEPDEEDIPLGEMNGAHHHTNSGSGTSTIPLSSHELAAIQLNTEKYTMSTSNNSNTNANTNTRLPRTTITVNAPLLVHPNSKSPASRCGGGGGGGAGMTLPSSPSPHAQQDVSMFSSPVGNTNNNINNNNRPKSASFSEFGTVTTTTTPLLVPANTKGTTMNTNIGNTGNTTTTESAGKNTLQYALIAKCIQYDNMTCRIVNNIQFYDYHVQFLFPHNHQTTTNNTLMNNNNNSNESSTGSSSSSNGVLRLVSIPYREIVNLTILGNKLRCKLSPYYTFPTGNSSITETGNTASNSNNNNNINQNVLIMEFSSVSYMNIVREKILPMIFQHTASLGTTTSSSSTDSSTII